MLRIFGTLFAILAIIVLGADLWPVLSEGAPFRLSALGDWWLWLDKDSLQVLQPAVERHLSPALWDPGMQTLLEWPLAAELGVLAVLFLLLGGRRKDPPKRDQLDFSKR